MTNDDGRTILVKLLRRIAPEADLAEVDPDAPIQEARDLYSMDYLNLLTALSEETGIDVPEQDYPKLSTPTAFPPTWPTPAGGLFPATGLGPSTLAEPDGRRAPSRWMVV